MEITKAEFNKVINKFKNDYVFHTDINGEHVKFGLVDWDSWSLVCQFNNRLEALGEIREYIQNELRKPKAKLVDSWGNEIFKLYELSDPIDQCCKVVCVPFLNFMG